MAISFIATLLTFATASLLQRRLRDAERVLEKAREHLASLQEDLTAQPLLGAKTLEMWRREEKDWAIRSQDRSLWSSSRNPYFMDEQYREWHDLRLCSSYSTYGTPGPAVKDVQEVLKDTVTLPETLSKGLASVIQTGVALQEMRYAVRSAEVDSEPSTEVL